MPKRLRSDDDENLACLIKNHISDREVNSGVLKDLNMRNVHQKTLALLFKGQRNVANNNAENIPESGVQSKDKQLYRQLCLSSSGSFLKPATKVNSPVNCCSCLKSSCMPTGQFCYICSGNIGSTCLNGCSSCQTKCCGNCDGIRQCASCGNSFCSGCALPSENGGCVCQLCTR